VKVIRQRNWCLWLAAGFAILGIAVFVQVNGIHRMPDQGHGVHLAKIFSDAGPGFDKPLAETEVGVKAVVDTLHCDDIFYREYQLSGGILRVYVAYWAPNKIPTQLVASHTPDWCWSASGWTCREIYFGQVLGFGPGLPAAEYRVFRPPNGSDADQRVAYWHLVGGRLYDYGNSFNFPLSPLKWWRDQITYMTVGNREQYFIRLSSPQSFDGFASDPAFKKIVECLGRIGLTSS
jgi:hypothetical protein